MFRLLLFWFEVDHWHLDFKLHNVWFSKPHLVQVPVGSLQVESMDVRAILCWLSQLLGNFRPWDEVELEAINGRVVGFSAELLKQRGSETCWISKSTDPEH